MNSKKIQPKNQTKKLILSIIKNCETLINQTQKKEEETLEFKPSEHRKTFQFSPPITIEGSRMIGLTSLKVYISIFIRRRENNKFKRF